MTTVAKRITYTTAVLAKRAGKVLMIGGKSRASVNTRIETTIAYGVQARKKPPREAFVHVRSRLETASYRR
jgi:hypothetical protein